MPVIKFNNVQEFCDELGKQKPDRGIVRLTTQYTPSTISPDTQHVSVVATFSVEGEITRLEYYCGDFWGLKKESDEAVMGLAGSVQAAIEVACKTWGYEVRAGLLE